MAKSGRRPEWRGPQKPLVSPTHTPDTVPSLSPLPLGLFVVMGSLSETSDEKHGHLFVDSYQVDTGANLVSGVHLPLDLTESLRIRYLRICGVLLLFGLMISSKGGK
jgi:hypothetical protein